MFSSITVVFTEQYHFTRNLTGLVLLGSAVGSLLGIPFMTSDRAIKRQMEIDCGKPESEPRIALVPLGAGGSTGYTAALPSWFLHQLLGGTIEPKVRDKVKALVQEEAIMKYIGLLKDNTWPGGQLKRNRVPSTASEKAKT